MLQGGCGGRGPGAAEVVGCRDQEGRRGSEEAVPGTSVFPSSETRMSGQNIVTDDIGMSIYGNTKRHPLWKEGGTNQGRLPRGGVMTMFLELGQVIGQGGLTTRQRKQRYAGAGPVAEQ